ncbi:MAG: hypothetical protein HJJLKODD_02960 [Phycisphaerae bacterium]|nr:hypothetical protein [Phycisphaerae bacterium]
MALLMNSSKHDRPADGPCFVIGASNTATSTMLGLLNCHPEIFILFEVQLAGGEISSYGRQLLEAFPQVRAYFRPSEDYGQPYRQLRQYFAGREHCYRYLGDKIPTLRTGLLQAVQNYPVIFMVRDLRTWLGKNSVIYDYYLEPDVVPAALAYVRLLMQACTLPQVLVVRMEDLLHDPAATMRQLDRFLKLDVSAHAVEWWSKISALSENDPKTALPWWKVHPSSLLPPAAEDTQTILNDHPFWDHILPIFDRYYQQPVSVDAEQLRADRRRLARLGQSGVVPLQDLFRHLHSVSFKRSGEDGRRAGYRPATLQQGRLVNQYGYSLPAATPSVSPLIAQPT